MPSGSDREDLCRTDFQSVLLRQLKDNRLHQRFLSAVDRVSLRRLTGDMEVLLLLAVLFPAVRHLHRAKAAVRLAIVGVDAEVEDPGRVVAGSHKAARAARVPCGMSEKTTYLQSPGVGAAARSTV